MKKPVYIGSFDDSVLPTPEEFNKSFAGTYLWFKSENYENGNPFLAYVKELTKESLVVSHRKLGTLVFNINTNLDVWCEFPPTGFFEYATDHYPVTVAWIGKKPARQWKKAPCQNNISILASPTYRYSGKLFDYSFGDDLLIQAHTKKETSLKDACEIVSLFKREVILNKKFILSQDIDPSFKFKTGLLWMYFKPIARINLKTLNISQKDPLFTEEIKNLYENNLTGNAK